MALAVWPRVGGVQEAGAERVQRVESGAGALARSEQVAEALLATGAALGWTAATIKRMSQR